MAEWTTSGREHAQYWDDLSPRYQAETRISTTEFHYGPLIPGDSELQLLPDIQKGHRCLELGSGAGQNSLVLARKGADCIAVDASRLQLQAGRDLASQTGAEVVFRQEDMDALSSDLTGFHLIHSAYGIPFSSDPEALIADCASRLLPGGSLIFSMGHPVYAGEWWDVDNENGIFLTNYFQPTPDVREGEGEDSAQARAFPVSECFGWCTAAGLQVTHLAEPKALSVSEMNARERAARVPYDSEAWAEQEPELQRVPIVLVLRADKPE